MRRILVEKARKKKRLKHGGGMARVDLDSGCAVSEPLSVDLLALDEALTTLALEDPMKARLVTLRYFAGLTMPEAADVLGVSLATADASGHSRNRGCSSSCRSCRKIFGEKIGRHREGVAVRLSHCLIDSDVPFVRLGTLACLPVTRSRRSWAHPYLSKRSSSAP